MQMMLRQSAEPALLALARSWGRASTAAAPLQDAACSVVARQLSTLVDEAGAAPRDAPPDAEGQLAASSADAAGAGSSDSGGSGGAGSRQEGPPGFPHRFNEPYRPDIRRFVHRVDQQQPPLADSVLQGGEQPSGPADSEGLPPPHLDLVQQYLSEDTASTAELRAASLRQAMLDFQRFEGDTGSSEVQVARLTQRISQLAEHMRVHRKDYASRRGLEAVIAQRRALLQYLRRKNFAAYAQLISRLGLRDTYAKLDRVTLQIQQRRERGPSKPRKGRGRR